jgi:hypothetical protein
MFTETGTPTAYSARAVIGNPCVQSTSLKIVACSILPQARFRIVEKQARSHSQGYDLGDMDPLLLVGGSRQNHHFFGQDQVRLAKPFEVPSTDPAQR